MKEEEITEGTRIVEIEDFDEDVFLSNGRDCLTAEQLKKLHAEKYTIYWLTTKDGVWDWGFLLEGEKTIVLSDEDEDGWYPLYEILSTL